MKKFTITLTGLVFSLAANAGGHFTGNGGDALVCFKNIDIRNKVEVILRKNLKTPQNAVYPLNQEALDNIESVEVLDLYLMRNAGLLEPKQIIKPTPNSTIQSVLKERMDLLGKKSSLIYYLMDTQDMIPDRNWSSSDSGVLEIDDSQHVVNFPENCILLQLARQDTNEKLTLVSYDKNLFTRMDVVNQAALLVHEWGQFLNAGKFLSELPEGYVPNTRSVHLMVGLMFRDDFESMESKEFNGDLNSTGLGKILEIKSPQKITLSGQTFLVSLPYSSNNNQMPWSSVVLNEDIQFRGLTLKAGHRMNILEGNKIGSGYLAKAGVIDGIALQAKHTIRFHGNGKLASGYPSENQQNSIGAIFKKYNEVTFDKNGQASGGILVEDYFWTSQKITFAADHEFSIYKNYEDEPTFYNGVLREDYTKHGITVKAGQGLGLYENGNIRGATLTSNESFQKVDCKAGYPIMFYSSGHLKMCTINGDQELMANRNYSIILATEYQQFFHDASTKSGQPLLKDVKVTSEEYRCIRIFELSINTYRRIGFHENGRLAKFTLCDDARINNKLYRVRETLTLDKDGNVTSRYLQ